PAAVNSSVAEHQRSWPSVPVPTLARFLNRRSLGTSAERWERQLSSAAPPHHADRRLARLGGRFGRGLLLSPRMRLRLRTGRFCRCSPRCECVADESTGSTRLLACTSLWNLQSKLAGEQCAEGTK